MEEQGNEKGNGEKNEGVGRWRNRIQGRDRGWR